MNYSKEDYAKYRLERAKEAYEEVLILANIENWNTVTNRLYYTCFYAASAYLILHNIQSATHTGIKSAFNLELIKSQKLPASQGDLYNKLFLLRNDADYEDFKDVTEAQAKPLIPQVGELLEAIEKLINEGE